MGMTMTQKILAAHAGLESVESGQLILVNLDLVLGNDITSPVAIKEFSKLGTDGIFDKNKVTMVMDHFAPNKDSKAAEQCKMCRDFCNEKDIKNFFDVGEMGIEQYYNDKLTGTNGSLEYQTDANGYKLIDSSGSPEIRIDKIDGMDIYLTIDSNVQMLSLIHI